ncbi:hypothetical protein OF83DRAFT_1143729 [Amylostereum chailletii]|nr:hypothetical protein OF83DRAFT_1143729 [Amylostereum chailletii]
MGSHAFFKRVNASLGDPTLRADSPDRDICRSFLVSVVGEQGIVENWVLLLAFPRVLAVLKGDDGPGPTEEERDARVCCGWIGCEYYCSPNPSGKLLRCSRCNDARYCDRKCQVRDWKEGGHKKLCGKKG